MSFLNSISVYPNPANESFVINTNKLDDVFLTITNTLGQQIIANKKLEKSMSIIQTNNLKPGVYFLSFTLFNEQKTIRLIVK